MYTNMRVLLVLLALALYATQTVNSLASLEVQSAEILTRFREFSSFIDLKSIVLDPFKAAIPSKDYYEFITTLELKSPDQIKHIIDEILGKGEGDTRSFVGPSPGQKNAKYMKNFFNPCLDFISRMGRSIEMLFEGQMVKNTDYYIALTPVAVFKVCKSVVSGYVAQHYV